jgi:hypothetical protein
MEAVRDLIRTKDFWPTISEIRTAVAERQLGLPSALGAWELVTSATQDRSQLPKAVVRALEAVGGSWGLKTTDNLGVTRAHFMRYYEEARRDAVEALVNARESVAEAHAVGAGGGASVGLPRPAETLSVGENARAADLMVQALAGKISYDDVHKSLSSEGDTPSDEEGA